ncbi:UDP-3-O-acyl-N-acetylglucosamine deacetylase [Leptothermofonsia sp. ETS-13]|uniref:UDP-3-O-acyl-N-acetylglucosamine deacetylase n=1 Tax=Leptothermofonsia sp. ETS-13 TaxID=3035696 RepID=UPI003BA06388
MEVEVSHQASPGSHSSLEFEPNPVQSTLAAPITCQGVGLHTGVPVQVKIVPAPVGRGRYFVRIDLPGQPEIPAREESVVQTTLSTELAQGEARVRTVEHLLAAMAAMGVDNARIELDGPEVPLLDGSAKEWAEAIAQVGLTSQTEPRPVYSIQEPLWIQVGDAFVAALPTRETRFTYGIDFDLPAIGNQWHSWPLGSSFMDEIAPARTFGLLHQIEYLRHQGLIKGGSLENALVCGPDGWINPPLRFANEPARHKLLDLVGDLSLLGYFPVAHFLAYKASHHLHTQLARSLASIMTSC